MDFGKRRIFSRTTLTQTVQNTGTQRATLIPISDNPVFTPSVDYASREPVFPASATLYFGADSRIQDANGAFYLTDQGYGIYGTTNGSGVLTFSPASPSISITSPSALANIPLYVPFNVEWTAENVTLVNIIFETESGGYKIYENIDATLGIKEVNVGVADGILTDQLLYIYIEATVGDTRDVRQVTTRTAAITNLETDPESPEPATDFELSGESTYLVGEELTLLYSTDDINWPSLGTAVVQPDGTWSKADCRIADAGTYYLRAIYGDEVVGSESISVTVESGVETPDLTMDATCEADAPENTTELIGTLAIDVSCTADTPTDI